MRITEAMRYLNFVQDAGRAEERAQKAQQQVSTGKKVSKPSDDPGAAADIVRLNSDQNESDQYLKNLTFANSKLQTTDGILDSVETVAERTLTLAQSSVSTPSSASAYTTEVTSLRDQLVSIANTTYAGRYIFGGSLTTTAPYVKNPDTTVTYNGDGQTMPLEIGRGVNVATQVPGSDLFTGTVDIFQTLSDLANAMQSGDKTGIDAQVQKIEKFTDAVSVARSKVGGYLNLTTNVESNLSTAKISRQTVLSQEEAADLAAAISDLNMSQNALQATLASNARLSQLSIWNYLT